MPGRRASLSAILGRTWRAGARRRGNLILEAVSSGTCAGRGVRSQGCQERSGRMAWRPATFTQVGKPIPLPHSSSYPSQRRLFLASSWPQKLFPLLGTATRSEEIGLVKGLAWR